MKKAKDFYIGWQPNMPEDNKHFLKNRLYIVICTVVIVTGAIIFLQKPFKNHQFNLGNVQEVTGVYYDKPYPMLVAAPGSLSEDLSRDILLVGYGKFGAMTTMDGIQSSSGQLSGQKVTLQGTLIHGDGRTVMELTKGDASLIKKEESQPLSYTPEVPQKLMTLNGEILDPKCYFGVMKPGEGKIHKSCAIRCISGGIPPVFRHDANGTGVDYQYYIMVGVDGAPVNQQILQYVAEQVNITGKVSKYHSWNVIHIDPREITML